MPCLWKLRGDDRVKYNLKALHPRLIYFRKKPSNGAAETTLNSVCLLVLGHTQLLSNEWKQLLGHFCTKYSWQDTSCFQHVMHERMNKKYVTWILLPRGLLQNDITMHSMQSLTSHTHKHARQAWNNNIPIYYTPGHKYTQIKGYMWSVW